jgi:hypothetical protein
MQRLEKSPLRIPVKDERTGETVTVVLGPEDFQQALYSFGRSETGPAELLSLYHEQYDGWARRVLAERKNSFAQSPIHSPLIDTSLGITPRREYLLRSDPVSRWLGHWNFDSYLATAGIWPTADVGGAFRSEAPCSIPVVFINGDWDVQTPLENLVYVTPYFTHSRTIIALHGRHGAMSQVAPRVPALLAFIIVSAQHRQGQGFQTRRASSKRRRARRVALASAR